MAVVRLCVQEEKDYGLLTIAGLAASRWVWLLSSS